MSFIDQGLLVGYILLATAILVLAVTSLVMFTRLPIAMACCLVNAGSSTFYLIGALIAWPDSLAYALTAASGYYAWLAYQDWKNRPKHKKRTRALHRIVVVLEGRLGVADR